MVATKVSGFGGMLPIADDRLLPDNAAARSENAWLYAGALAGMNVPTSLRTLSSTAISRVYRIPNNFADSQHLNDAIWMEFQDIDTDVVRSLVFGDTFDRYYFVSPSSPPQYNTKARIAGTNVPKSLLHFDGTNTSTVFYDSALTGGRHTWTAHNTAQLSTGAAKFGVSSGSFSGISSQDWIDTPANTDYQLGSGDWTIDFWFTVADTGVFRYICGQADSLDTASLSSFLIARTAGNKLQGSVFVGSTTYNIVGTTNVTTGSFHHCAFVRSGGTLRLFLDGNQEGTTAITGTVNTSSRNVAIGRGGEIPTSTFYGNIDEWRLSPSALWTAGFSVPTAAADAGGPWLLGVPTPGVAPVVTPTGGSSTVNRTAAYVYTWVTAYGEEGPPSPATVATGKVDATWGITLTAAAASDIAVLRNLSKVRIYRTVTSASGVASFFLVVEQNVSTTTYNDTLTDTVVSANSLLASTTWTAPPSDLKGFTVMPNGIVAGFRANEIWFCEPYRPHAWPASYTLTVDFPIVGMGVVGQTLVVCTQGYPTAISGIHPSVMTQSKLASLEPCLSRGSILSAPEGVYYASPNGLVLVANGTVNNVTQQFATKDQWQKLVTLPSLSTLRAARVAGAYYSFGSLRPGVFEETAFDTDSFTQADFTGSFAGVLVDPASERFIIEALTNTVPCTNVQNDPWTGELFVIRNGVLYWVDIASTTAAYEVYTWKSKIFQTPLLKNFEAFKIYLDLTAGSPPVQNPVRYTDSAMTLQADMYGLIKWYADGRLVSTREIRTSGEMLRIPSGFKAKYWQFEIQARVKILSVEAATSAKELAGV